MGCLPGVCGGGGAVWGAVRSGVNTCSPHGSRMHGRTDATFKAHVSKLACSASLRRMPAACTVTYHIAGHSRRFTCTSSTSALCNCAAGADCFLYAKQVWRHSRESWAQQPACLNSCQMLL